MMIILQNGNMLVIYLAARRHVMVSEKYKYLVQFL